MISVRNASTTNRNKQDFSPTTKKSDLGDFPTEPELAIKSITKSENPKASILDNIPMLWEQLMSGTYKTSDKTKGGRFKELPRSKNATYLVARWRSDSGESWLGGYNPDTNKLEVDNKHNPYSSQLSGKSFDIIIKDNKLIGFSFLDEQYLLQ